MPEAKLAKLLKKKCNNILSWDEIVDRQRELYAMYLQRDARLDDVDYMAYQMVTAIVDEYAEYEQWSSSGNQLEQLFEAIDLFHFALEGAIAVRPDEELELTVDVSVLLTASVTANTMLAWSHETMHGISWKHWKNPVKDTKIRRNFLKVQFSKAMVMSIVMFRDAYVAWCASHGTELNDIDLSAVLAEFRRFYTLKAEENTNRQKNGY
jgi:hypothetical protein